jgi:DNA-binding response OmpR family regulator
MYALLITEDSDDTAIYSMALQRAGLAVTATKKLKQAMQEWPVRPADLILLSLSDPVPEEQVRQVRAETPVPLILTLDRPDERLYCELLKLGADLVIIPSTSTKVLIAQITVLLRRARSTPTFSLPTLMTEGLSLNPENRTIEVINRPSQHLTHLEFRLLYTLMINRGQVIPTETIVERVWGYTGQGDRDLIRGLVSRLRAKVEVDPHNPHYILTVPGVGYTFRGDTE